MLFHVEGIAQYYRNGPNPSLKDFESFKSNPITESITNEGNPQDNKIAVTLKYVK